ncbi:MAG: ComEA family DNA-binding protein [Chloroflexota bacterium]
MTAGRPDRYWTLLIILAAIILAASLTIWLRRSPGQPLEIAAPPAPELAGEVHVSGAVSNPGIYPLKPTDSIADILKAAGGTTPSADPGQIRLHISNDTEEDQPQKVNLNRASTWLLAALPGIGQVRAQAIVDYRLKNGPFLSTHELTRVESIGTTTYEEIKDLITVTD